MTEEREYGNFYSFDQLLAIVRERGLHSGGALFCAPPKSGRKKKRTVIISAGELSGLRCCACGCHFFRGGNAGKNEEVVVLRDQDAKILVPLCDLCVCRQDRQGDEEQQITTAGVDLKVGEEGQITTENGEHCEMVVGGTTVVVTSEFTPSCRSSIISVAGVKDDDLLSKKSKSNGGTPAKCLRRERVSGATAIRRSCRRRGVRK
jgi:hypothetical protein